MEEFYSIGPLNMLSLFKKVMIFLFSNIRQIFHIWFSPISVTYQDIFIHGKQLNTNQNLYWYKQHLTIIV